MGNYLLLLLLPFELIISLICGISKYKGLNPYSERVGKIKTAFLFVTVLLGLLVNYFPSIKIIFIIFLILSIRLEEQSMIQYINQYNYKKNLLKEKNIIEDSLERSKELSVNKNENIIKETLKYLFINIKLEGKNIK